MSVRECFVLVTAYRSFVSMGDPRKAASGDGESLHTFSSQSRCLSSAMTDVATLDIALGDDIRDEVSGISCRESSDVTSSARMRLDASLHQPSRRFPLNRFPYQSQMHPSEASGWLTTYW